MKFTEPCGMKDTGMPQDWEGESCAGFYSLLRWVQHQGYLNTSTGTQQHPDHWAVSSLLNTQANIISNQYCRTRSLTRTSESHKVYTIYFMLFLIVIQYYYRGI